MSSISTDPFSEETVWRMAFSMMDWKPADWMGFEFSATGTRVRKKPSRSFARVSTFPPQARMISLPRSKNRDA